MSFVARLLSQQPRLHRLGFCVPPSGSLAVHAKSFRFSTAVASTDDELKHENESFLTGTSSIYAEEMYERYSNDPNSVHESWKHYFDTLTSGNPYDPSAYNKPTAAVVVGTKLPTTTNSSLSQSTVAAAAVAPSDSLGVAHLIRAYQVNGHMAAKLDPLVTYAPESFPYRPKPVTDNESDPDFGYPPELTPAYHGFHSSDLDRVMNFRGTSSGGNKGYLEDLASSPNKVTLRMILNELRKNYTNTLGVEYMVRVSDSRSRAFSILHSLTFALDFRLLSLSLQHIGDPDKVNWIRERVERPRWLKYDKEKKQHIYERLCFADTFETFLAQKFNTTKRFGLDGGEAIVPALKDAIDRASELGAHSFVLGMPHRGRLNVLANVMRKPMPLIFSEFQGTNYKVEDHLDSDDHWGMSGDVKCTLYCVVLRNAFLLCVFRTALIFIVHFARSFGFLYGSNVPRRPPHSFEFGGQSLPFGMCRSGGCWEDTCETVLLWQSS